MDLTNFEFCVIKGDEIIALFTTEKDAREFADKIGGVHDTAHIDFDCYGRVSY